MSASIVDKDHIELWRGGRPVDADALGPWTPERTREVLGKLRAGILLSELLSAIPCPECRSQMTLVRRTVLHCENCKTTFDTTKDFHPGFYAYNANVDFARRKALDILTAAGFSQGVKFNGFPRIVGADAVATLRDENGTELDLVIASARVERETLYQLWGFAKVHSRKVVLVHPGLAHDAEQLLELALEVSPVLSLEYPRLENPDVAQQVALFPKYRDLVTESLAGISRRLSPDGNEPTPDLFQGDSEGQIDQLARTGGEQYQLPALKLLMALGPTVGFTKAPWVPDGVLLVSGGFWIVDPKSSEKGFSFSTSERDKIARYLDVLEKREHLFGPSLKFHGEIIITRTDPINPSAIESATSYLRSRNPDSVVALVSHEAIRWLWDQIKVDPGYWHLRDAVSDTENLLKLRPKSFEGGKAPDSARDYVDAPLKVIGPEVLRAHWTFLHSRGIYPQMGGRTPSSVAELVQGIYVQEFVRLK